MFKPEELLEHLDMDLLTVGQAVEEIWRLTTGARDGMSADYYLMRLGAIEILTVFLIEKGQGNQTTN